MKCGSAGRLHTRMAERHPDSRRTTVLGRGLSLSAKPLSIWEGLNLPPEQSAAENLELLLAIAGDGPTTVVGNSKGSQDAILLSAHNLAASGNTQINVTGVQLVNPAIGARNIDDSEKFRDIDADNKDFVYDVTGRFFRHMPGDIGRMALSYPEPTAECAAVLAIYGLEVDKFFPRMAVIAGNLRGVQEGVDWETIKDVAVAHKLHVLGGELDPLVQAQLPQLQALKKVAPDTLIWILKNRGHALSIDGAGTVEYLDQMEQESLAIAA